MATIFVRRGIQAKLTDVDGSGEVQERSSGDLRALFAGAAVSRTGDWIYIVTLLVYVYDSTRSTAWVAAASIGRIAPALVLSHPATALARRFGPRRVLIASDAGRAAAMAGLAFVAVNNGSAAIAIALAALSTIIGAPSVIARDSLIAASAGEDELAHARARTTTIEHISLIVGEAGAGLVLLLSSAAFGFSVNAATFLISVLLTLRVRATTEHADHVVRRMPLRQMPQAARDVLAERGAATILVAVVVATIAYGQELVLSVLISKDLLDTGSGGVGFLKASVGLGGLATAFWFGRAALDYRIRTVFATACLMSGVPLALLALVHFPLFAYMLMFGVGAGNVALDVISVTLVRRSVRPDVAHHMFSVMDRVGVAAVVAGSLLAPALVAVVGLRATLIVTGSVLVLLWIPIEPALARLESIAAERVHSLTPLIEVLRAVPIFHGASRAVLEEMASEATNVTVPAGAAVFEQGDDPGSFYVVRSGTLDVSVDGRVVNTLEKGGHFGEIGLLERVPRTAAVTARTDAELIAIDGDDFLTALDREPALAGPLTESALSRLGRSSD